MHLKRWITGLVAAPLLVCVIVAGSLGQFAVVTAVAAVVALWEYNRLFFHFLSDRKPVLYFLPQYLLGAVIVLVAGTASVQLVLFVISAEVICFGSISLFRFRAGGPSTEMVAGQLQGIVYIALPFSLFVLIRSDTSGALWLLGLLGIIFAGDTAAYYAGSYLGKHKLCPAVSPKKTVEGSLGGLAANALVGVVLKLFFLPAVGWGPLLLMCVLSGAAGQAGDLFESVLKRTAGVKDSGRILPGHGGILDRVDALLFAAPVVWVFITKVL